eukprot:g1130.t1
MFVFVYCVVEAASRRAVYVMNGNRVGSGTTTDASGSVAPAKTNVIVFESKDEIEKNARLYEHQDIAMQRRRTIEISGANPEDRCLDVGCGQGFLLADLTRTVTEVHGVDVSEGMLQAARKRAPRALLQRASAVALPYRDETFDIIFICQVLVYVSQPRQAILEARRCLKPGGRLIVLDSVWSQSVWHAKDVQRQTRVLRAFDEHAMHPSLPMRIPALISSCGLSYKNTQTISIVGTSWKSSWGRLVAPVIASYVVQKGLVKQEDAAAWLADIRMKVSLGQFFFNINRYVFFARKISH